ncbi:hypothetical protein Bbelb_122160 [Branchiostoma belcheri]|nr:hypothetical protein Bbelb_122160 [Branchiostoma belcheri]
MPEEWLPKFLLEWTPNYGKRSRGRPRKTWLACVLEDARTTMHQPSLTLEDLKTIAHDRQTLWLAASSRGWELSRDVSTASFKGRSTQLVIIQCQNNYRRKWLRNNAISAVVQVPNYCPCPEVQNKSAEAEGRALFLRRASPCGEFCSVLRELTTLSQSQEKSKEESGASQGRGSSVGATAPWIERDGLKPRMPCLQSLFSERYHSP